MDTWGLYNGDLATFDGEIRIKSKMECLADRINAVLSTIVGETDDITEGVDYYGIVFAKTPISLKVVEFTRAIKTVEGVDDVQFVGCRTNPRSGVWTFIFDISSIYGNLKVEKDVANIVGQ